MSTEEAESWWVPSEARTVGKRDAQGAGPGQNSTAGGRAGCVLRGASPGLESGHLYLVLAVPPSSCDTLILES